MSNFNNVISQLPRSPNRTFRRRIDSDLLQQAGISNQISLDDDITNEAYSQQLSQARIVSNFLKTIHDGDHLQINTAMARNVPDILKYHEYNKNADDSYNVDWYDLKGKSVSHLKWDANYWQGVAVNNKSSWLNKLKNAQKWQGFHQDKINRLTAHSKAWKRQAGFRDKWKAKASEYSTQKDRALAKVKMYQRAAASKSNAIQQARVNSSINAQIQANDEKHYTSIYRADHQDPTVISVSELSPNEQISMNLPTKSIDKDIPEGDFANVSEMQLSGTYYVFIENGDRDKQYNTLKDWTMNNHRVVVRGFSHWSSTMIQSIGKQIESTGAANSLELPITFQYQRVATIEMAKQKAPAQKSKGKTRKRSGRNSKPKPTTHKVKPGDNLWNIAGGSPSKVKSIEKANPKIKNPNLIYPGQKVAIPK